MNGCTLERRNPLGSIIAEVGRIRPHTARELGVIEAVGDPKCSETRLREREVHKSERLLSSGRDECGGRGDLGEIRLQRAPESRRTTDGKEDEPLLLLLHTDPS